MKKYKWLIILVVVIVILSVIAIVFSENEEKYLHEISYSKVMKKIDNNDKFMLYIKQTDCEHCKVFTPRFVSVLKENKLESYVLNLTNLSDEDKEKYDKDFSDISGTPTVLFYDEGMQSLVKIEGEQTKEKILSKIKSAGFLK